MRVFSNLTKIFLLPGAVDLLLLHPSESKKEKKQLNRIANAGYTHIYIYIGILIMVSSLLYPTQTGWFIVYRDPYDYTRAFHAGSMTSS